MFKTEQKRRITLSQPVDTNNLTNLISVRATQLEAFSQCPFAYKYRQWEDSVRMKEILYVGKVYHNFLQTYLLGRDTQYLLSSLLPVEIKDQLKQLPELLKKEGLEPGDVDMVELTYAVIVPYEVEDEINWKVYNVDVYLEWTLDALKFSKEGGVQILDFKTASSLSSRKGDKVDYKKQKTIYPYLFRMRNDMEIISFDYIVFQKSNTVKVLTQSSKPDKEEVRQWTLNTLDEYVKAVVTDNFAEVKQNPMCVYCKFKRRKECPLYSEEIEI